MRPHPKRLPRTSLSAVPHSPRSTVFPWRSLGSGLQGTFMFPVLVGSFVCSKLGTLAGWVVAPVNSTIGQCGFANVLSPALGVRALAAVEAIADFPTTIGGCALSCLIARLEHLLPLWAIVAMLPRSDFPQGLSAIWDVRNTSTHYVHSASLRETSQSSCTTPGTFAV